MKPAIIKILCYGKDRKPYYQYKFRTMRVGTGNLETKLSQSDLDGYGKVKGDSRVTPLGRILRRYWLDEVPNLVNLFKGDMKFIGMRGIRCEFEYLLPEDIQAQMYKHKPGLVGIYYAASGQKNFDDYLALVRKYFKDKEKHPFLADLLYLNRFLYNAIFYGLRSK